MHVKSKSRNFVKSLFALVFLFSSCDFGTLFDPDFNAPVKDFFDTYTNTVAVARQDVSLEYPLDNLSVPCIPSDKDATFTFYLRNPKLYKLTPHFTLNSGSELSSDKILVTQNADDKSVITLIYKQQFLEEKDTSENKDISGILTFYEPLSGRTFESYPVNYKANTPPPGIQSAMFQLSANAESPDAKYIICFFMPKPGAFTPAIHTDTEKLTINGRVLYIGSDGTLYDDIEKTTQTTLITATKPSLNPLMDGGLDFDPDEEDSSLYKPLYYITDQAPTDQTVTFSFTTEDSLGLKTPVSISNKAKKLQPPSHSAPVTYQADEETGLYNFVITHNGLCTDDTASGSVTISYVVKKQGQTEIFRTGSSDGSAVIPLPAGKYDITAKAGKSFYITSEPLEITGVHVKQTAIFYISETGSDSENTGASASPFRTIQHALDTFKNGITAGDYDADGVCEVRVMTDLTVPEGFSWNNSSGFVNITSDFASSTIKIKGYGANRTIDFESSGTNLQRTAINVAAGTVEIDGISITKLADNGNAVKALNVSGGTVTYKNSSVHDNRGNVGASIWISGGNLELRNVTVKNVGSGSGTGGAGALNISGSSTVNCYDCSFTDVYGVESGAINISAGGSLTMQDSSILRGKSSSKGGGITNMGTLSLKNVSIKDCVTGSAASWATNKGSGIYHNGSQLTLENVTISGCTFNENTGSDEPLGAGIYNYAHLNIKGKNQITGNYLSDGTTASNIYLRNGEYINVTGDLTGSRIGVYVPFVTSGTGANAPTAGNPVAFTSNFGIFNTGLPGAIFTAENGYGITLSEDGEAAFAVSSGIINTIEDYDIQLNLDEAAQSEPYGLYPGTTKTFKLDQTVGIYKGSYVLWYNTQTKKLFYYNSNNNTVAEPSGQTFTLKAVLYNGGEKVKDLPMTGLEIPVSLTYEGSYTIKVTANFMGATFDCSIAISCDKRAEFAADRISSLTSAGIYDVKVEGGVASGENEGLAQVAKAIKARPAEVYINLDAAGTSASSEITSYNDGQYFNGCKALKSIRLPSWMEYVIHDLFYGCTSLESISMSESTQYIGKDAFKGCTSLTSITLPKDITGASSGSHIHGIDTGAFAGCTSLADIYYEGTISDWTGVNQGSGWHKDVPASVIHCIDGDTAINPLAATPLTLEAKEAGAVVTFSNKASGPVTYRVNGGAEQTIEANENKPIPLSAVGDKVQFYGDNTAYATDLTNHSEIRCSGGNCYVYGNIMSLISSSDFANATTLTAEYTFMGLFYDNKNIINKSDKRLSLPATSLTSQCYNQMFGGCEGLTEAPALPATTLVSNCYKYMFCDCTGLTTAPELPATSLADSCYEGMFYGCTNLTTAPALPATTLASYCYQSMFSDCTSLTNAPSLPATTLDNYCYNSMFSGCTSLTAAPVLSATTLASNCYQSMFSGCTNLTTAPALPAMTLTYTCYTNMFLECTKLEEAPALPATTLAVNCYQAMFQGCTSLTSAPALPATKLESYCYKFMFYGCTSLATAPALPATTLANSCYQSMFKDCTGLSSAPALPATTLDSYCYNSMFSGCTSLTAAPVLSATTLASNCYQSMFFGCTSLTAAPALPATTLVGFCYESMFYACTSLTTAPELPATKLEYCCYQSMFRDCTNLNRVTCLATDISAEYCTYQWLSGVASTGTFINSAGILGWSTGESGIPEGWTVVNYGAADNNISSVTSTLSSMTTSGSVNIEGTITADDFTSLKDALTELNTNNSGVLVDLDFSGATFTEIPAYAFKNCSNIRTLNLPESLETIGEFAFSGCKKLETIYLPKSITNIGNKNFSSTEKLTTVYFSGELIDWLNIEMSSSPFIATLGNLETNLYINNVLLEGELIIPNGVERIGDYKFWGNRRITKVTIPNTVRSIGYGAFQYNTKLTEIIFPDAMDSIEQYAFRHCNELTSITLPEGITELDSTFYDCSNLTTVNIPNSLTKLISTFRSCTKLTTVTGNIEGWKRENQSETVTLTGELIKQYSGDTFTKE